MDQNFIDNMNKKILFEMGEALSHLEMAIKQLSTTAEHYYEINDNCNGNIRDNASNTLVYEMEKLQFLNTQLKSLLK